MAVLYMELIGSEVRLNAEQSGKITAFWTEGMSGAVRYVQVDLGGWLRTDEALLGVARLAAPVTTGGPWHLEMSAAELDQAPRWPEGSSNPVADWPPVIIGPFGHTLSLPLMGAQLSAEGAAENAHAPQLTNRLERVSAWCDQPVFARDGELGVVCDVGIDLRRWRLDHLRVAVLDVSDPVVVPFDAVRHRGAADRHIVVAGLRSDYAAQRKGVA